MPKRLTRILAIETSCDETSVAILDCSKDDVIVIKNLVSSQIPIHQKYGGVVPEVAARSHVPEIVALLSEVPHDFDAIAVTRGPGLATALGVGVEAARTLAYVSGKPLIGVNHLEGHMASAWLNPENRKNWKFPLLALIVSGGHTELVLIKDFCKYKIVGQTRDDAAGEAFDKSAKLMGLPYPGGPHIAKLAEGGDVVAFAFPRPMLKDDSLDFSFSGLKTAVRQEWEKLKANNLQLKAHFAASLQQAIVDVLVEKTIRAAKKFKVKGVLVVGGVSANTELRRQLGERIEQDLPGVVFLPSDRSYVTDNAAMIGAAGYWRFRKKDFSNWKKLEVDPELNV
ncbi:tRNA (adenosine(37)-N6)-threonylcarbamoyltransferase complex transferase subunit TsaD [Candidatus Uhrbacteria bacterium]|nr:tRNA (adenosine(37)-N6)-threonylcarbamoyltransferase complex transferase subunit TsaD [Candidatus Uhrbacteria bacterium]